MMSKEMRQAVLEDVPTILALLQKRIDWMDEKGLYQWNKTAYLTVYPAEYFAERIGENSVFLAMDGDKAIGVIALFDVDPRWDNDKDAYYVHHLSLIRDWDGKSSPLRKPMPATPEKKCCGWILRKSTTI